MSSGTSFSEILLSRDWHLVPTQRWMTEWVPTACIITVVYLLTLYVGQKIMANFKALQLDMPLALWNLMFALFSLAGTIRLLPELIWAINNLGIVGSYCDNARYYLDPFTGYWGWLFVMSKTPELGDSLFLVLRKRPVMFLHWYHHALTFIYAQATYAEEQAWCRWSLAMNLVVHTIMYSYFFVRALKYRTPAWIAQFITTIQIVQFVVNCAIFAHLLVIKTTHSRPDCTCSWFSLGLGSIMYISYLYLFAQFFYRAYIVKKKLPTSAFDKEKIDKAA